MKLVWALALSATTVGPARAARPAQLRDAVVKVQVLYMGIPVSVGTGFFVSRDGVMVTNDHVVSKAFNEGYSAVVETADGTRIPNPELGACSDERRIDLCVLKLPYRPKAWFSAPERESPRPEPGSKLFVIGHPKGYDFTLSDGIVSAWRTRRIDRLGTKGRIEEVQISAPISPGNSGGPIFDERGELLGMSTWVHLERDAQNLNFGVAAEEVWRYVGRHRAFASAAEVRRRRAADERAMDREIYKNFFAPAFSGGRLARRIDPKSFAPIRLPFASSSYDLLLPNLFKGGCRDVSGPRGTKVVCRDRFFDLWGLTISVIEVDEGHLKTFDGRKANPEPFPLAQDMMARGTWEQFRSRLSPAQVEALFSAPQPYRCRFSPDDGSDLARGAEVCSSKVLNDGAPKAMSIITGIQKRGSRQAMRIVAWSSRGDFGETTEGIVKLVYLSGKEAGAAAPPRRPDPAPAAVPARAVAEKPAATPVLPEIEAESETIAALEKKRETLSEEEWRNEGGRRLSMTGRVDRVSQSRIADSRVQRFLLREQGTKTHVSVTVWDGPELKDNLMVRVEAEFDPSRRLKSGYSSVLGWLTVGKRHGGAIELLGEARSLAATIDEFVAKRAAMSEEDWLKLDGAPVRLSGRIMKLRKQESKSGIKFTHWSLGRAGGDETVSVQQPGWLDIEEGQEIALEGTFSPAKKLSGRYTSLLGWLRLPKRQADQR